jgi:glycosyltransferase involved in cell wall biosynthesis
MKILQLTSYPTKNPQHGGQIRSANIASALRSEGHVVFSVGVFPTRYYIADCEYDIEFKESSEFWREDREFLSDFYSGIYAAEDREAFEKLNSIANEEQPDVIVIEQPWLIQAAVRLKKSRPHIKLVYSSHNIEFRLKEAVLGREHLDALEATRLVKSVKAVEHTALTECDLIIACTQADADFYSREIADCTPVVVAGNGVEPFSCRQVRTEQWRHFINRPFPVFVSSAHPPNANGFWDMMAPGLTFLRPDEHVIVAGGVSDIILQMAGARAFEAVNLDRMKLVGRMEKSELQALIQASHVVLLPITQGEGSNLKTAEAIESGCSIVGTSKAFRGFENALTLPHIHIANEPADFRKAVRHTLDAPRYDSGTPLDIRSAFHWSNLLATINHAISSLEIIEMRNKN